MIMTRPGENLYHVTYNTTLGSLFSKHIWGLPDKLFPAKGELYAPWGSSNESRIPYAPRVLMIPERHTSPFLMHASQPSLREMIVLCLRYLERRPGGWLGHFSRVLHVLHCILWTLSIWCSGLCPYKQQSWVILYLNQTIIPNNAMGKQT